MFNRNLSRSLLLTGMSCILSAIHLSGDVEQVPPEILDLPPFEVQDTRVALPDPVNTFPMPVSALRYEPVVDVQSRNFAEAQADVSIRGGTFENTGFKVGAATLYDPQTGHYFAEIPIAPAMLSAPEVLTGVDNALEGFNSTVGTIAWGWLPITTGGVVSSGIGTDGLNFQRVYGGYSEEIKAGMTGGIDAGFARSEANGTVENGDHEFHRYSGRAQLRGGAYQTDFYAGYQSKFFGWPELYAAPFNSFESEDIQTTLFLANHRVSYGGDDYLEVTGYYRRNRDHYQFNRFAPNNAFVHETKVWALGAQGAHWMEPLGINVRYAGQYTRDDIDSTALTFGPYSKREYYKVAVVPEKTFALAPSRDLVAQLGFSYDDTNRDTSAVSPIAGLAVVDTVSEGATNRYYLSFAKTTQVAGYTALKSAPAGLFGGNANLGRERTYNYEAGIDLARQDWTLHTAVFYRHDKDLADWTFTAGTPNARQANPVTIDTIGWETVAIREWKQLDLIGGYTYLHKNEDYRRPGVTASFYALNYPEHRFTGAVVYRFLDAFELRSDNEFRVQEKNALRQGTRAPLLSSLGLYVFPPAFPGLELAAMVDNLWDADYQEVPGTPAAGRQFSVSAAYRF